MKLRFFIIALIILGIFFGVYSKELYLKKFTFNDSKEFKAWNKMILNGAVEYTLMKYGSEGFIQAHSDKSCSALYYRLGFNLKDYPILSWKWRVLKFPDVSTDMAERQSDDYAARVYVIFPFLNFSLSKFIEYVWARDIPAGTVMNSPAGDNIKIIVARSSDSQAGDWALESRNVYEDYSMLFGKKPKSAGAIAIMCDADSTKSQAEASFDDIAIEALARLEQRKAVNGK